MPTTTANRNILLAFVAIIAIAMIMFTSEAFAFTAAGTEVRRLICTLKTPMTSIGYAVAFLSVLGGAVAYVMGNRNAVMIMAGALVGGVLLSQVGTIAKAAKIQGC